MTTCCPWAKWGFPIIRSGAVDYIKKTWGTGELEDRIAMALGYRGQGRQQYRTHVFHQNC